MKFPIVLITVQTAAKLLERAASQSPESSNLRDELQSLAEQVTRVQNAIAANGYNAVGMDR